MTRTQYLFSPWWRVAWLIIGVVWLIGFNAAFIMTGAQNEWLGIISIVPVVALLIDVIVRDRRWQQRKQPDRG